MTSSTKHVTHTGTQSFHAAAARLQMTNQKATFVNKSTRKLLCPPVTRYKASVYFSLPLAQPWLSGWGAGLSSSEARFNSRWCPYEPRGWRTEGHPAKSRSRAPEELYFTREHLQPLEEGVHDVKRVLLQRQPLICAKIPPVCLSVCLFASKMFEKLWTLRRHCGAKLGTRICRENTFHVHRWFRPVVR